MLLAPEHAFARSFRWERERSPRNSGSNSGRVEFNFRSEFYETLSYCFSGVFPGKKFPRTIAPLREPSRRGGERSAEEEVNEDKFESLECTSNDFAARVFGGTITSKYLVNTGITRIQRSTRIPKNSSNVYISP